MGQKQDFAARVERIVRQRVGERQAVHTQMCMDAALIAANEVFHMGPTRAPAFAKAFSTALGEIIKTTMTDSRDLEYTKTVLDARLRDICGDSFEPWDVRYG